MRIRLSCLIHEDSGMELRGLDRSMFGFDLRISGPLGSFSCELEWWVEACLFLVWIGILFWADYLAKNLILILIFEMLT